MEKRKNPRFRTRFDALYSLGSEEGSGVLAEISYSSARLDEASQKPEPGTKVRLYVFVQPIQPFELAGHVVRHTGTGFAIDFDVSTPEIERLVDDVRAIVTAPDRNA
jgi:hypothetical protein